MPDPQEYDMSDPDRAEKVDKTDTLTLSAKQRLDHLSRLVRGRPDSFTKKVQ